MATLTVYSDVSDGRISNSSATYSTARAGSGSYEIYTNTTTSYIGQILTGGTYFCREAFFAFDTSSLGSGATISTVVFSLSGDTDASTTDFTMEARLTDWGASLETSDFVPGASQSGLTLLASFSTGSFTTFGYNDFIDSAFPANINKTGFTRFAVCSSRHRIGNTPSGNEYVNVRAADYTGTTDDPKLVITGTWADGVISMML